MYIKIGKFGTWLMLTTAISSAYAEKVIDFSNKSETGGPYEISFCSRPSPEATGLPGHVFVAFSSAGPDGTRSFKAVGLQANSLGGALKSLVTGSSNGYVGAENYTAIRQNCLVVKVNKANYEQAWNSALPSFTALGIHDLTLPHLENYGLGAEDCIGYVQRVGNTLKGLGLKVPDRKIGEFPRPYIQRMEAAN
jgi:hypothetical protein